MVKKLRKKFVLVTTVLMLTVFGIFFAVNTIYNNYQNNMEMVSMLDWIAHCGIFSTWEKGELDDELVLDVIDAERPIIGIILDNNNEIISKKVIGIDRDNTFTIDIDEEIINEMLYRGKREYKIGEYFYSYNVNNKGQKLLVIMDDRYHDSLVVWWIGRIGIAAISVLVLLGVTFYLSRYVTEPAEQSLLREKRFISDASHELKTPIGAISINAQALEIDYKENLYLKNIISESERMSRLIERLLMLSKFDEADIINKESISLSDICEEVVLTYEAVAYERGLTFSYEIGPFIDIIGVEDEIRQLLVILIDNAIKNTDDSGEISLCCKKEKNSVCIKVANTGHGISPDDLPHIFERFYSVDESRNNSSFGLGLAIAKAIVERHGGVIEAKSELNKLTEFNVYI